MSRRVVAVVIALGLTIATSCSFPRSAVPGPDNATPAPAGVPASDQDDVSTFPLLQRLGRWNGSTFVPVTAGSISSGHVVVMTHGWAVGWLSTYESRQSSSTSLVPFWDAGFTDPKTGQLLSENFVELATSLQQADPTAQILMYTWIDQSSTPLSALAAYAPERATEINGHRMATAIDTVLAPGFTAAGGQVHLIGHSFGANVATTAALALSTPPVQLTLFDSPEVDLARFGGAKNDLRYKLPRLAIGRGPGSTFVDNYISEVGEEYHGYPGLEEIVDVRLRPPSSDNGGQKHEFPIGWYASTTASGAMVGYQWSPMAGASDTALGALYRQQSADQPLTLTEEEPAPTVGVDVGVAWSSTPLAVTPGSNIVISSPVTNIAMNTNSDSLWLTYDLGGSMPAGQVLDVYVDGRQRSTMSLPADGTGRAGRFVILYDVSPGSHVVSFVVDGLVQADVPMGAPSGPVISDLAIVSASDIDRNLTPSQIRTFARWAIVAVIVAGLLLLAVLVFVVVWIVRRIRRRRRSRELSEV